MRQTAIGLFCMLLLGACGTLKRLPEGEKL